MIDDRNLLAEYTRCALVSGAVLIQWPLPPDAMDDPYRRTLAAVRRLWERYSGGEVPRSIGIDADTLRAELMSTGDWQAVDGAGVLDAVYRIDRPARIDLVAELARNGLAKRTEERAQILRAAQLLEAAKRGDEAEIGRLTQSIRDAQRPDVDPLGDQLAPAGAVSGYLSEPLPPRSFLLMDSKGSRGVIPAHKPIMLAGEPGVGKSYGGLGLAIAVASGHPWLNRFHVPSPGNVCYLSAEDDGDDIRERAQAIATSMGLSDAEGRAAMMRFWPIAFPNMPISCNLLDADGMPSTTLERLSNALVKQGAEWRLVIVDPMINFGAPETEVDSAMAAKTITTIADYLGTRLPGHPSVAFIHHTTKATWSSKTDKPKLPSMADMRGSGGIAGSVRWAAILDCPDGAQPNDLRLTIVKSNGAPVDVVAYGVERSDAGPLSITGVWSSGPAQPQAKPGNGAPGRDPFHDA